MKLRSFRVSPPSSPRTGFTLLELLIVIGILFVLISLTAPSLTKILGANDLATAAYMITGAMEQARNHAMANNTYTWIGFYEEDATTTSPTNATPAYPGKGRLIMAIVASRDGTRIFDDNDISSPLPPARISQIGKLIAIPGLHITDIGPPSPSPSSTPEPNTLGSRSYLPYAEGSPFDHYNRINSDSSDRTKFSFNAQGYTFHKTVRFSPRGEANLNSTYSYKHVAEIGLRPTHGSAVDIRSTNIIAIQFSAIDGNFKIYRR
jgi:type II secretory pathway pseudopilin PulG